MAELVAGGKMGPVLPLVDSVVGILDKVCLLGEECLLQVFPAHYLVKEVSRRFPQCFDLRR